MKTKKDKNMSMKEFKRICQPVNNLVLGIYVQDIALYLTRIAIHTPLTPNIITLIWILMDVVGAILMLTGDYWTMLIGIIIFQSSCFIDCVDGQLACYRNQCSLKGAYLEQIGHYIGISFLLISLTFGVFEIYKSLFYLIVGGLAVLFFFYNKAFTLDLARFNKKHWPKLERMLFKVSPITKKSSRIILFEFLRIEQPLSIIFWFILFGKPQYGLLVYCILYFLETSRRVFAQLNILEKMK